MTVNTMSLPAGEILTLLRQGWEAQKRGGMTASWMIHGRPGVGKTQVVQQLADEIGGRLFDLRLTTIEPQDLRGLPYYDHEAQKTLWYRPEDLPDDPDRPAVLFLDELTSASPYLQPTVYGLLQERRVGRHRLPDCVFIVAAGNAVDDGAVAYEMGTALSDRLVHLHLQADLTDWLENYAAPKGLSPAILAFLRARPDLFETIEESLRRGDLIACTPRSWERASAIMAEITDRRARNAMLAGVLGQAVAAEFTVVADEIAASVRIDELLASDDVKRAQLFPDSLHGLNAVIFGLIGAASPGNIAAVIECMEQVRRLATYRDTPQVRALPLAELCAFGFEILLAKALKEDMSDAFAASVAYQRYAEDRRAAGLE